MGIGSRLQSHKAKLNKETNDDTFRRIQNPGTPKCHRSVISHSNVIKNVVKRYPRKVVYIVTNIQTVSRTHTRKDE